MNNEEHIPPDHLDEIERFLQQDMSAEEEKNFLTRLSADSALKKNVDEMRLLFLGIQEDSLQERLDHFHKGLTGETKEQEKQPVKLFWMKKTWLAAASVLLIMTIGAWFIFFKPGKNDVLFSEYFKPDPGLISAMSTSANYTFDKAMIDYKTGNYNVAIKQWESLLVSNPGNDTLNYFLGAAHLALENSDQAIGYLQKVTATQNSAFTNDANWYLGLAHIKQGKKENAIPYIERSDHHRKAALLSRLK